jgi:hypothetical protein
VTAAAGVGAQVIDALGRRDYVDLAACFTPDAQMRAIVPPGLREDDGADAIAARFRLWTSSLSDYELVGAATEPVGALLRLSWVVRGVDADKGLCLMDQTAYAEVEGGLIRRLRLACSGSLPVASLDEPAQHPDAVAHVEGEEGADHARQQA